MVGAGSFALCGDAIGDRLVQPGGGTALGTPNSNAPVPTGQSPRGKDKVFTALQCGDVRNQLDFTMRIKRLSRLPRGAMRRHPRRFSKPNCTML